MKTQFLDLMCVAVLGVLLALGLWPFHSPRNEVAWLGDRNGLRFGRCGTVISSSAFPMTSAESGASGSVEVWLQPRRIWDKGTFLAFYNPGNPHQFSLRQSGTDFELQAEIRDDPHPPNTARLDVETFRRPRRVFLTITSDVHGTAVYADGVLARTAAHVRLSTKEFTGRLVLGDSPGQPDNWSGELLGLAIYRRELTAAQVLRHYETWTQGGRPEISEDERNIALYRFGERTGNVVHDQAGSGMDLYIPERCLVPDKILLEPFWKESSMSWSYWDTFPKNIVGFIPFGFCFCACLTAHKVKRAALASVILGATTSLTIEFLQAYLPTRDSGTTDIFTNTFGTWIGVWLYAHTGAVVASVLPWLPFGRRV